jgi:hypothetical protein
MCGFFKASLQVFVCFCHSKKLSKQQAKTLTMIHGVIRPPTGPALLQIEGRGD